VTGALVINFIAVLRERNTVLAFLVRFMSSFAFYFLFNQVVLETHMLCYFIVFVDCTIYTLFIGPMFASSFHNIMNILNAVSALACRSVVAAILLYLLSSLRGVLDMLYRTACRGLFCTCIDLFHLLRRGILQADEGPPERSAS
jgi:hypothetical protein